MIWQYWALAYLAIGFVLSALAYQRGLADPFLEKYGPFVVAIALVFNAMVWPFNFVMMLVYVYRHRHMLRIAFLAWRALRLLDKLTKEQPR